MADKKIEKTVVNSGIESDLLMVKELIENIKKQTEWTKDDEVKLKKLDTLVGLMNKIAVLEKKFGKKAAAKTSDEDKVIIERFLARMGKR